ncbi:DinB family protein [Micromonospora sp. NPDC047134]|uniref:DinB family protein n=1 Tax=Micromonospora sp. NPDC047134 TaxID=3154340 RepID=UPI00340FF172
MAEPTLSAERADLLETLQLHRFFLRNTTRDLTDEQIGLRSTVSELCLGGLIKHVAGTERNWVNFIQAGPTALPDAGDPASLEQYAKMFQMSPGETLAGVLATYDEAAKQTDDLIRTLPDLDFSQPLPDAPWFTPGARWSARRVLLHLIAETAQHAGHADIIREAIDGAKSMG